MRNKLISILTLLPMLLAVFLFTDIQTAEASGNDIQYVYYDTNVYTTDKLISVKTPTEKEIMLGPERLSYTILLERNVPARFNTYQYVYERDRLERDKVSFIKTYNKVNTHEVYQTTVYKNGSTTRSLVQRYETIESTYSTTSVTYTPYKVISKEYRNEIRRVFY